MNQPDTPEPLWREVVGDTDPWRRGRLFLILLAVWQFLSHLLVVASLFLAGHLEIVFGVMLGAILFWFSFYFIWTGVHWVRWIAGGSSCLIGFAKVIWGVRDGSGILLVEGAIAFASGAYLALAPSVYFFALRQKAKVRWKESLVVAAIFAVLLMSASGVIFALNVYKARLQEQANAFADQAFHSVFLEYDTEFLRAHATKRLVDEIGWERMSAFTTDCYLRVGVPKQVDRAQGNLFFRLQFPLTVVAEGIVSAQATSESGPVRFNARIGTAGSDWEIDAIWWRGK